MLSIADLIDKLVIENIKIFHLRENLHDKNTDDESYVEAENKMNLLNENRGIIMDFLDEKVHGVVVDNERNSYLRNVKTYAKQKKSKNS
tara:strand:+ start:276 stop:542 length:267 start_codon:yes stop_codon:yes gene_type:complete